jgi:hypothetical protein
MEFYNLLFFILKNLRLGEEILIKKIEYKSFYLQVKYFESWRDKIIL